MNYAYLPCGKSLRLLANSFCRKELYLKWNMIISNVKYVRITPPSKTQLFVATLNGIQRLIFATNILSLIITYRYLTENVRNYSQPTFTCSNLQIKHNNKAWNVFKSDNKYIRTVLVSCFFTVKVEHILLYSSSFCVSFLPWNRLGWMCWDYIDSTKKMRRRFSIVWKYTQFFLGTILRSVSYSIYFSFLQTQTNPA